MSKFKPTLVKCLAKTDSFKHECKGMHTVVVDGKEHKMANTYRFVGRPLLYLIKNEEDYNEIIANPNFEDYEAPAEKEKSAPSETTKERKEREKAAAKLADSSELKPVPAAQTDGADSITNKPVSD